MDGTARDWVLRVVLGRDPEAEEHGHLAPDLHPELADLDATLKRIRADQPGPMIILAHHLELMRRRGVRIAALRPAPVVHTARLVFADGTVVVVRADRPVDLPDVAVRLVRGERVRLTNSVPIPDAVRLELTTTHGLVHFDAVGFDQAD